jgi:signal transduction histidine kinase
MSNVVDQRQPLAASAELDEVLRAYLDLTDRLQHTHETLQREVLRLRNELAAKNRELELRRRLAALGELAAGVAHEVRNPLGAIQLYSDLLRRECQRLDPALQLIDKIEAGIRAIDGVVQDTLALAPRPGKLAAHRLQTIMAQAHDACRQTLAAHEVELHVEMEDTDVRVLAEADGLRRVLVNLLVNAAEASPPGRTIWVRAGARRDGEVELRVSDEGCGLSSEVRERLFDPFFTTKQHGTGLGLTIAHRLLQAYGGQLTACNRPGGGAEFTLVLPATGAGAEDDGECGPPARVANSPTRQTSAA